MVLHKKDPIESWWFVTKKKTCCILRHCHADTKTNTFSQNIIGNESEYDIFKPQYKPNSAKNFAIMEYLL